MNAWTIVNMIASSLITFSGAGFLFTVQQSNDVRKMHFMMQYWIRLSLASVAAGGMFNVLTLSTPHWSEILLNVGIGLLFTWAVAWHKERWTGEDSVSA